MANRLAGESSLYLLQHADNPVDWYPWGEEAFVRARREDKPVFLSIGYSACHWCHVMERESFTDAETAALLNAHYVCIKVDREERPDLDAIYLEAVSTLTGQGGWPLSVWLDGGGNPFYGGTYFPPAPRHGMPSFGQVLRAIVEAWQTRRDELRAVALRVRERLAHEDQPSLSKSSGRDCLLEEAARALLLSLDPVGGGWGDAPKFPQPLPLGFLLARQTLTASAPLDSRVKTALDAMAAGGIYDHLGGGFHRYSTDGSWLVPHFEKMLYDNTQLARCYLHAHQLTGISRYREVATGTLDYLLRRMCHEEGGFFSAEDADSEGKEGAYYLWTPAEIADALDPTEAALMSDVYGVTPRGHLEGASILHVERDLNGLGDVYPLLAAARDKLLRIRGSRTPPARDEKIVAGWNGLALTALAEAARALPSDRYRDAALATGRFLASRLLGDDGRLRHSWQGGRATGNAFLDDHACVIEGLLALYQTTFDEAWFQIALTLTDTMIDRFLRPGGGFYDTADDHESLIVRPRSLQDSPTPSGNSIAAAVLLQMAVYTGDDGYRSVAEETLATAAPLMTRAPVMAGRWLWAAQTAETGMSSVALVGDPTDRHTLKLKSVVDETFRPFVVVAAGAPQKTSTIPVLAARASVEVSEASTWVCSPHGCSPPTHETEKLRTLLLPPYEEQRRRSPGAST